MGSPQCTVSRCVSASNTLSTLSPQKQLRPHPTGNLCCSSLLIFSDGTVRGHSVAVVPAHLQFLFRWTLVVLDHQNSLRRRLPPVQLHKHHLCLQYQNRNPLLPFLFPVRIRH